jgi:hypothetical protein
MRPHRSRVRWRGMAVLAALAVSAPAHAYIDPGTGSALLYVVSGVVVSAYFAVRGLWYRLVDIVLRARFREQNCEIAVHGEDPRYETTFLPILRRLAAHGRQVTYFTMYARDGSYAPLPEGVVHREIPSGMVGYAYLNHLQAVLMVTTTPQLDVMTFRRSARVRHYAIVSHALGECRYVRPYAYDYYDSVLCCGPILENNIRRMEAIRGLPPKRLLATGIPHYEELLRRAQEAPPPGEETVVLVAPSWGPLSMFEAFGTDFVEAIARRYRVIVRPHPQMKVSQPALYQRILGLEGVTVDTSRTPADAMSRAHILLSDISGITHEFAFIYGRPVVIIDRQQVQGGLEGEVLGGDSDLKRRCSEFIVPIDPAEIGRVTDHLARVLESHSPERLRQVRDELVYNFASGGEAAARQIGEIYEAERAQLAQPHARATRGRWSRVRGALLRATSDRGP